VHLASDGAVCGIHDMMQEQCTRICAQLNSGTTGRPKISLIPKWKTLTEQYLLV
jgi:hypothetical protein